MEMASTTCAAGRTRPFSNTCQCGITVCQHYEGIAAYSPAYVGATMAHSPAVMFLRIGLCVILAFRIGQ